MAIIAQAGNCAASAARWTAHQGLSTLSFTAKTLRNVILLAGSVSSAALAYDTYAWHGATAAKPIWAHAISNQVAAPALSQWKCASLGDKDCLESSIAQAVSRQSLIVGGLFVATPLFAYACHQAGSLADRMNRSF